MFEIASRKKYRFTSYVGSLTVEDLWDLPLTCTNGNKANLDDVARLLHKQLKSGDDVSFVETSKKSDPTIQAKFDIVKHIIDIKLAERETAANAKANSEKKQQLLAIIEHKQTEALLGTSVDELRKMVADLST